MITETIFYESKFNRKKLRRLPSDKNQLGTFYLIQSSDLPIRNEPANVPVGSFIPKRHLSAESYSSETLNLSYAIMPIYVT